MCGSARGCANPPAGQRLWSFITRCAEERVGRQHSLSSDTPVRDKSHNAEPAPLGGGNVLHWAINQQLVISTSYSRLASYKRGNSCRQEPQGKQDVKIREAPFLFPTQSFWLLCDWRSDWVSRSANRSVIAYCHGFQMQTTRARIAVVACLTFNTIICSYNLVLPSPAIFNNVQFSTPPDEPLPRMRLFSSWYRN